MRKIISFCSILFAFTFVTPMAKASLITSDLNITGNVEFDIGTPGDPLNATGNASQTAIMTFMQGLGTTQTTINNVTPTATNPLGGNLTDYGDGIGVDANSFSRGVGEVPDFIFDLGFSLMNSSATDTYQVFFALAFSNALNADGLDAFIDSEINLYNSASTEIFFSDLTSDTLVAGGPALSESGTFFFDLTLSAGGTDSFSAVLKMDGKAYDNSSLFDARSNVFISVISATNLTNTLPPSQVPEPSTVMLFIVAIALFQLKRRANN